MGARFPKADLVAGIYDAALNFDDPSALPRVMAGAVASSSVVLFVANPTQGLEVIAHNLPDDAIRQGFDRYFSINPYAGAVQTLPFMRAGRGEDILPLNRYRKTEFFADFAAPLDAVEVIGAKLRIAYGIEAEVCLHRGQRDRLFADHEVAHVQSLLPHIQRALQLRRHAGLRNAQLGFAALELDPEGKIILDPERRIVFANSSAEALAVRSGFALGGGQGILLSEPADQMRLHVLVRDAATGGAGGSLTAATRDDGRMFLLVAPLPLRFGVSPGHVLVAISQPGARHLAEPDTLRRMFGLTVAEARLASALASGKTIPELIVAWELSENTLRSQLSAIFAKTGTASQRGLVALIEAIPVRNAGSQPGG